MQLNVKKESPNNGGSKQVDYEMMKKDLRVMFIDTFQQVMPDFMNAIREAVKEEVQSALSMCSCGGNRSCADKMTMSEERKLELKFSEEVSLPVLTGKMLRAKSGKPLRVSLIDSGTGQVVDCEKKSSAKVDIFLLRASGDDKDSSDWSLEDFNSRIIVEDDKKKPHLAKSSRIHLKNGVGTLSDVKLGHGAKWMKSCKCRLGARMVEKHGGFEVKVSMTEPFVVSDSRSILYKKHPVPSLSDELWRLEKISKDGKLCERLNDKNIRTVQDLLFLHAVDPDGLRKIAGAANKLWNVTVDHARRCNCDDEKVYLHRPRDGSKTGVVYNAVGGLKGVLYDDAHFVPIDNMSSDEKDDARKLLRSVLEGSAFGERYNTPFDAEGLNGCGVITEGGSSSQCIDSSNLHVSTASSSFGSEETGELFDSVSSPFRDHEIVDRGTPLDLEIGNHEISSLSGSYLQTPYRPIDEDRDACDVMIARNTNDYYIYEAGSSRRDISTHEYTTNLSAVPSCHLHVLENANGSDPSSSLGPCISSLDHPDTMSQFDLESTSPVRFTVLSPIWSNLEHFDWHDQCTPFTPFKSIGPLIDLQGFRCPGSPTTGLLRRCSIELRRVQSFRSVGSVVNIAKLWVVRTKNKKRKRVVELETIPSSKKQTTL